MERLGDEVRRSLGSAGVPDAGLLAEVTRAWPAAVGPTIAAAAWPARAARDGTLIVTTISSVWAFELQAMADVVTQHLTEALPGVALPPLKFVVGHVPAPAAPAAAEPPVAPVPVSPETAREAELVAAGVEDERLREIVRRAATASLARQPHDRGF